MLRNAFIPLLIGWGLAATAQGADLAITNAESTAAGLMGGRFDSREALKQNAIAPLQGQTLMTDQNGNTFDATVQCGSAKPMLDIFASPGATGDLASLVISADLDLDGTPDSSISPAVPVSGVCANGFISCDVGTWDNCNGWEWTASTSAINVQSASIRHLKGCYCINNSCGSSLSWANLGLVLKDLGSGVARAVQKVLPSYVITDVQQTPTHAQFYGASSSGCRSGTTGQDAYLGNSPLMNSDLANTVATESADSNSLYSIITNSSAATGVAVSDNNCAINRSVPVSDTDCTIQPDVVNDSCASLQNNPDCVLKSEIVDGVTTYDGFSPTGLTPLSSTRTVTSPSGFYPAPATYNYELSSISYGYAQTTTAFMTVTDINLVQQYSSSTCTKTASEAQVLLYCNGDTAADCEYGTITIPATYGITPNTNVIWVNNGCRGNFAVTGLIQEPCGHDVTRAWWDKDRVYQCLATPSPYNFDDALHRTGMARQSATVTGFTETHKDATGNWVNQSIALGQPGDLPQVDNCEQVCKVKKEEHDNRVTPLDVTQANRTAPGTRAVFRYPVCDRSGVCPAGPGETVINGCQCVNDFAEAATIMQLLRQAGQDIICSPANTSNIP